MDIKAFRKKLLQELTNEVGVYALCDLDQRPLYIGQSADSITARVQRHITSARSDVIANRQLDIWEVYEVWAWPVGAKIKPAAQKATSAQKSLIKEKQEAQKRLINELENHLIHFYNNQNPLVNGKLPPSSELILDIPQKQIVRIMPPEERALRREPSRRLPRQLEHLNNLFSHILEVKNNPEQRRMLRVHFNRTESYYKKFMSDSGETEF